MFTARVVVYFRQMETYQGRRIFEEELKKEGVGQRGEIDMLRVKYTAKMILKSLNKKKAEVLANAEVYNKVQIVDYNPLMPNDVMIWISECLS